MVNSALLAETLANLKRHATTAASLVPVRKGTRLSDRDIELLLDLTSKISDLAQDAGRTLTHRVEELATQEAQGPLEGVEQDVLISLCGLGCSRKQGDIAVRKAMTTLPLSDLYPSRDFDTLFRKALSMVTS